jgi:hypothetical protein
MERIPRNTIGRGNENTAKAGWTGVVLKETNFLSMMSLAFSGGVSALRREIAFCEGEAQRSEIKVPRRTRVVKFPIGFKIGQDYIPDDGSLTREQIAEKIERSGTQFIKEGYKIKPENYHGFEQEVYLVDLTFGYARILGNFISIETKNHYKLMTLNVLRRVGVAHSLKGGA